MDEILHQIFNGEKWPCERAPTKRENQIECEIDEKSKQFCEQLNAEQKKIFEELLILFNYNVEVGKEEDFVEGIRYGVRFLLAAASK